MTPERLAEIRQALRDAAITSVDADLARELLAEVQRLTAGEIAAWELEGKPSCVKCGQPILRHDFKRYMGGERWIHERCK